MCLCMQWYCRSIVTGNYALNSFDCITLAKSNDSMIKTDLENGGVPALSSLSQCGTTLPRAFRGSSEEGHPIGQVPPAVAVCAPLQQSVEMLAKALYLATSFSSFSFSHTPATL